jgi:hypothetical protein
MLRRRKSTTNRQLRGGAGRGGGTQGARRVIAMGQTDKATWDVTGRVNGPAIEKWQRNRPQGAGRGQRWRNVKHEKHHSDGADPKVCAEWCKRKTFTCVGESSPMGTAQARRGNCGEPEKVTRPKIFHVTCCGMDANSGHLNSTQILLLQRCPYGLEKIE